MSEKKEKEQELEIEASVLNGEDGQLGEIGDEKETKEIEIEIRRDKDKKRKNREGEFHLSEEIRKLIPRPGDYVYVVQPYDPDDDSESTPDRIEEDAIVAYSIEDRLVTGSVLTPEMDFILINGDFRLPLAREMKLVKKNIMVYTREDEAYNKWQSLMNVSLNEAKRRRDAAKKVVGKCENTVHYIEKALRKDNY